MGPVGTMGSTPLGAWIFMQKSSQEYKAVLTSQNLTLFWSLYFVICLDIILTKCLKGLKYQKSLFVSKF